jgi:hypothetical protein
MTEFTWAESAKELGCWPAAGNGWAWAWQRCGRTRYRKCLVHLTNPAHLVPTAPSPTHLPPQPISGRYAAGRPRFNGV